MDTLLAPISVMDMAYAAGLFDGEGCIRIHKQQFPNWLRYQLHVQVVQSDPRALLRMQRLFGGSFHKDTNPAKPTHRQRWSWHLTSRLAVAFLLKVRPYLILKAEEADLAIQFQQGMGYHRSNRIPLEEIERRERIRRRMTELKHVSYDPADFGMVANSGDSQTGQSRAKQRGRPRRVGVCNESMPPPTGKRDSELHGNMESAAEMTAPREA